ncbi:CdaR family protein [Lagierella sp.]|uniref:CdaR family protein n=1 Tax=Lagierella sp. TaxID=2849657 RepID=UPI00260581AE|nr:CdaR family protein [Lagierella sp.]
MERIKNNWPFKLISLVFAIALWYYVVSETNPTIKKEFKSIPVNFKNEETLKRKNLTIVDPLEPIVNLKLEGKRNVISRIKRTDIDVYADLNEINDNGEVSLNFAIPQGTSIVEKSDNKLSLKLDEIMTLVKKVDVKRLGELPSDNITVTDIEVVPEEVKITGQKELIDKISKVLVPVDISVMTKDTTISKKIEILDANDGEIENLDVDSTDVTVNVFISSTKQVPIKISAKNKPFDFNEADLKLAKSKITIIGAKDILDKTESVETEVIDLEDFINNTTKKIKLHFPQNISPLSGEDKTIDITYSADVGEGQPSKVFTLKTDNIDLINKKEGKALVLPANLPEVSIRVFGEEKAIDLIKLDDIALKIDLKDLDNGEHNVPIIVDLKKEGVTRTMVNPSTITVKIVDE